MKTVKKIERVSIKQSILDSYDKPLYTEKIKYKISLLRVRTKQKREQ